MGCSNAYYRMVDTANNPQIIRLPESEISTQNPTTTQQNSTGVVSLGQFTKIKEEINEIESLKKKGLSDIEIKLYLDYKKGQTYLENVHKNMDSSELNKALHDILERIGDTAKISHLESDEYTSCPGTSNFDKHSIDPNFRIKDSTTKPSEIHENHPLNHLAELEDDLFGHMDVHKLPPLNKRRKLARRMARKYAKEILIPEPAPLVNIAANEIASHSYNDFIKQNPINNAPTSNSPSVNVLQRNPNSKWDIKDVKNNGKNSSNVTKESINNVKKIGCSTKTLYTIQNCKIVRLKPKNLNDDTNKIADVGIQNKFDFIDIKLPINKAEEQLLEGSKLSITDIKMLPKFTNYESGELSKRYSVCTSYSFPVHTHGLPDTNRSTQTLYVKNIASAVTESQLKELFQDFEDNINVKLMTGKMKGQAFVTFQCSDIANSALHQRNGTILKGRPIIIQFGKKGNG